MNKPQVNINLNIDIELGDKNDPSIIKCQLDDALSRYNYVIKQMIKADYTQDTDTTVHLRAEQPTSRHHQSVAANTRIMDAIEFINKEMRLLKGHSENGTLKVFEEIRRILLGI